MTSEEALKRTKFWQNQLFQLAIDHIAIEDFQVTNIEGSANAIVYVSSDYDRVRFEIDRTYLSRCTEEELDRTLLHEWIHVGMRDVDRVIDSAEDYLSPQAREVYADNANHVRENFVDRLANAFFSFHKKT